MTYKTTTRPDASDDVSRTYRPKAVDVVFPESERTQVSDTTRFPWKTIGELEMRFPDGEYSGTGTLIGERLVLTAAHNLYDHRDGEVREVSFTAGRSGEREPYETIRALGWMFPAEWRRQRLVSPRRAPSDALEISAGREYDYALVLLERAPHLGGHLGVHDDSRWALEHREVSVTGYPDDKPTGTMWTARGALKEVLPDFLTYKISTSSGESGAAVVAPVPEMEHQLGVVGVHIGSSLVDGERVNLAVRISTTVRENLARWGQEMLGAQSDAAPPATPPTAQPEPPAHHGPVGVEPDPPVYHGPVIGGPVVSPSRGSRGRDSGLIWRSGDADGGRWNGIEIVCEPSYANGELASVELTITDYWKDPDMGLSRPFTLVPLERLRISPLGDFTVEGTIVLRALSQAGYVSVYLEHGFSYGDPHARRPVNGPTVSIPTSE